MTEKEWVLKMAPLAQEAQRAFGYLASVLIAQTIQETGYGQTDLAQEGLYNVLGMKSQLLNDTWVSQYWNGETHDKVTPEWTEDGEKIYITDSFRIYRSYQDCLFDYCQFMRDSKIDGGRYKYRDLLGLRDPAELIRHVRLRGYCTDPSYDVSIMDHIRKWNLTQYDTNYADGGVFIVLA